MSQVKTIEMLVLSHGPDEVNPEDRILQWSTIAHSGGAQLGTLEAAEQTLMAPDRDLNSSLIHP